MGPALLSLKERPRQFVLEYCKDFNGKAAYERAGYKCRGHAAEVNAEKLLRKTEVQVAIKEQLSDRCDRLIVTADKVTEEWQLIGHSDMLNYFGVNADGTEYLKRLCDMDPLARRALSSLKIKRRLEGPANDKVPVEIIELRLWSKVEVLKNLGRVAGLDVDPPPPTPPVVQITFRTVESRDELKRLRAIDAGECTTADPENIGPAPSTNGVHVQPEDV